MRHATAEAKTPRLTDYERPLDRKGHGEVAEMARRFVDRGLQPDLILTSSALRTEQTAELLARGIGITAGLINKERELYLADAEVILASISRVHSRRGHLLVITHNPGVSELARLLAPDVLHNELPTCGTVTMLVTTDTWQALSRNVVSEVAVDEPGKFFDAGL
jgi:phosphohistidine phosphatase